MDLKSWIGKVYEAVDRKSATGYAAFLTEDVVFRYANNDPVKGRDEVVAMLEPFFAGIAALRHSFTGTWETDDAIILQGDVDYTRLDGNVVTLPFVTINRMDGDLARQVDVLIDAGPLFAE